MSISYSACSRLSRLWPSASNQMYQTRVPCGFDCGDDLVGLADLHARVVLAMNDQQRLFDPVRLGQR